MPTEPTKRLAVEQANVWRGIYGVLVFILAFSYLKPYPEYGLSVTMQRLNRLVVTLTIAYMCWLIFMLNLRPDQGRALLGYLDPKLNKPVTRDMHTYDDDCELT